LQALDQANLRAVVQGWDEALQDFPVPATVFKAGSLPHSWLFDQVSAVVHHGGFGTTAAVLRSGAPGIVIPHIIDQFYWGMRVHELGAGPRFIPRGQLSTNKLSAALIQVVSDPGMRLRSAELGECIRNDPDGVITAVRMIESAAAGWR
jgi:UDP:flavonoid glycosyltransferase YjiC (YdhE family)